MKQIDLLIIGAGMYVSGKNTSAYGTIIPAVLEARKRGMVDRVAIATKSAKTLSEANDKWSNLSEHMGVVFKPTLFTRNMTDINELMKTINDFKPSAVIVSIPDHLHAEVVIPLVTQGVHCLVVKPMATKYSDAKAMAEAAKNAGVVSQVEFHKRLDESNMILRDKVASGALGDLLYAVVEYSQRKLIPRDVFSSWSSKTNVFQYLGVHYVDLLQHVTGFIPKTVTAWGQKGYLEKIGVDTWDAIEVIISWQKPNGKNFVSAHITNWIDPDETSAMSDQKITVVGTKGRFFADQKNRGLQHIIDKKGVHDINPYFCMPYRDYKTNQVYYHGYGISSVLQFFGDVCDVLEGNLSADELTLTRPSFDVCVVSTAVIESALISLINNNKTIEIRL